MKLPKFRAVALLGLLTLAGLLTPREGAALRILHGWDEDPIQQIAGDPEMPGSNAPIRNFYFKGASTMDIAARLGAALCSTNRGSRSPQLRKVPR